MKGHGPARPIPFPLARAARLAAALFFVLVPVLTLVPGAALAADPSVAPKADQPPLAKKADPPILIGPSRVTLAGGKTIEAIAVFREPGRVRVVLEDDTEIDFDPEKVVSVVALADLPDEPPPAPAPAKAAPSKAGSKGAAKAGSSAASPRKGDKTAAAPGAGGPVKVHAEPAGNGKTTATAKGASSAAPAADAEGVPDEDADSEAAGSGADARKEDRDRDVEELAAMLQHAIANAALEGPGAGESDDESSADADEAAAKSGKDATGAAAAAANAGDGATGETGEKKVYKPRPEDLDATRPVNKAGFRFLGPKGKYPETPPQTDFPQPAEPTTSLGFGSDVWRPTSGFSSTVNWATPLPPATSFSNRLSGLDPPITSFGPSWWAPTPTSWPSSVFPEYWRPKDGFAQSMEQKNPPPPPSGSSSSSTDSSK